MRAYSRKYLLEIGWLLVLVSVVILTITLIFPDGARVCQKSEHTGYESCSDKYGTVIFLLLSGARIIQDYNGAFVALFTGFLVIITLQQKGIANRQVSHMARIERAYIFATPADIQLELNAPPMRTKLCVRIQNQGNTPGILREVYGTYSDDEPQGEIPTYPEIPPNGKVRRFNTPIMRRDKMSLLPMVYESRNTGDQYFFGYIDYTDIFGIVRRTRFCHKIYPSKGEHDYAGPPAWNSAD